MQQLVSSQTLTSTAMVCRVYFTTSCTGLMSPSESSCYHHNISCYQLLYIILLSVDGKLLNRVARCYDSPVFGGQISDVSERLLYFKLVYSTENNLWKRKNKRGKSRKNRGKSGGAKPVNHTAKFIWIFCCIYALGL